MCMYEARHNKINFARIRRFDFIMPFTLRKEEGEEYMYLIKKVLNVNVIIVEKDNKDVIAFGKGIGYRKKGQLISEEKISIPFSIEDNRMES